MVGGVRLEVRADNSAAMALYASLGFALFATVDGYYEDGARACRMALAFTDRPAPTDPRVQATEAYRYCAQEAIQLHGGVGFTWEYDPQLHFKRAQWASQWFGPTRDWREALAAHLLDAA